MLEQAFAVKWNGIMKTNINMEEIKDIKSNLYTLEGGYQNYFLANILRYVGSEDTLKTVKGEKKGEIWNNVKYAHELLKKFTKKEDTLVFTSTRNFRFRDDILSKEYDIYKIHAYTVKDYNAKNQIVYLSNPHYDEYVIEIPLEEFKKYFDNICAVKL